MFNTLLSHLMVITENQQDNNTHKVPFDNGKTDSCSELMSSTLNPLVNYV